MITKFSKWILFVSSYIPLYVIFIVGNLFDIYIKYSENNPKVDIYSLIFQCKINIVIIIFFIIVIFLSLILLKKILNISKDGRKNKTIKSIKKCNDRVSDYVLVYIIPFVTITLDSYKQLVLFLMIFLLLGYISVKNELVYINPILYFKKYNFYNVTIKNNECILISKKTIHQLKNENMCNDDKIKVEVYEFSRGIFII